MRAAVDHIEHGNGHDALGISLASEVRKVLPERYSRRRCASLCDRKRHAKDSVGTKIALVLCSIELEHEIVDSFLICERDRAERLDFGSDNIVDVAHSAEHTLAHVPRFVPIALRRLHTCPWTRRMERTHGEAIHH